MTTAQLIGSAGAGRLLAVLAVALLVILLRLAAWPLAGAALALDRVAVLAAGLLALPAPPTSRTARGGTE